MSLRKYSVIQFFCLCCFVFFSWLGYSVSGSIVDPALSYSSESFDSQSVYGFIRTEITRNIRISSDDFLSTDRQDGLFDGLYWKNDFSLSYSLDSYVDGSSFFNNMDIFFVLNYQRPMYASIQEIRDVCWGSVLCFGDVSMGISKYVLQTDRMFVESSVSLRVPVSKSSFYKSFLTGITTSFDTRYILFSKSDFRLFALSNHLLDLSVYFYETVNAIGTGYNVPFNTLNQLGLSFHYSRYKFIPALYLYGSYGFALNFYGTPLHVVSLHVSASWVLSEKVRAVVGLNWRDRILKPISSHFTKTTTVFHADRTFFSLGVSYSL